MRRTQGRGELMRPIEVPAESVPAAVRRAAEAMLALVVEDLGLPPLTLRWFRPRMGVLAPFGFRQPCDGFFRENQPDVLWIRRRRSRAHDAAAIVPHEARHAWQHHHGLALGEQEAERDAYEYAETKLIEAYACAWDAEDPGWRERLNEAEAPPRG